MTPSISRKAKAEIRKHSGLVACANLLLRQDLSDRRTYQWASEHQEHWRNVDKAVKKEFDGDWNEFREWAKSYLREGCGICG